jgi:signal peptidase I
VPRFSQTVATKLTADELEALKRIRWADRLTSLWAPVTVLACIFLVYLIIVESADCAYLWLQPPMQGLAGLAFLWWAALVVARFAARGWNARRLARIDAEELMTEIEPVINKHRESVKPKSFDDLVERVSQLLQRLPGEAAPLRETTTQVRTVAEALLASFKRNSLLDFGSGFVKALAIAMVVRSVLIEPFKIPSGSMIPTLEIGDQIFVNKFIYGVRIPFTNYVPFTIVRPPNRGDIIVFNNPMQPDRDFIKRIIGIGGDTIEFRGREVIVNGAVLPTRQASPDLKHYDQNNRSFDSVVPWVQYWFQNDWVEEHPSLWFEKIGSKEHYILYDSPNFADGSLKVPPGNVFVMGDNRDRSSDGRFGLGTSVSTDYVFVPLGNIKGKATVIWLPLGHGGWFSSIFGGTGLRVERLFLPLTLCADELPRVK